MVDLSDQWKGKRVRNIDVAATIRRYGAPAHSKPHGPEETILYYEDPAFNASEQEAPEDFAGTVTPGGRSVVEQIIMPRSALAGTAVTSTSRSAGAGPQVGLGGRNVYQSPNDATRGSEVEGGTNPEIDQMEQDQLDARADLHEIDTVAGSGRASANQGIVGTPAIGAPAGDVVHPSAQSIEFLDSAKRDAIRAGLRSEDAETRATAAGTIDELLEMIPVAPGGGVLAGGNKAEEPVETPLKDDAPKGGPIPLTPYGELAKAHPEWNYAFLDAKTKAELEALAEEVKPLGIEVTRTDGKSGPPRTEDYIAALRTDRTA